MAEEKPTFPYIPNKAWWEMRRRIKQSWPTAVTPDYLVSVLGVGEAHAQHLLSDLQSIGLISEDRKLTDLANDWRSDEHYAEVCGKIVAAHYSSELRDAFPAPNPDRRGVTQWFQRNLRIGEKAADKLAGFYGLLCRADVSEQDKGPKRVEGVVPKSRPIKPRATKADLPHNVDRAANASSPSTNPSLTVAVQIYISPESTPDQVEAIFASMAKHLGQARVS